MSGDGAIGLVGMVKAWLARLSVPAKVMSLMSFLASVGGVVTFVDWLLPDSAPIERRLTDELDRSIAACYEPGSTADRARLGLLSDAIEGLNKRDPRFGEVRKHLTGCRIEQAERILAEISATPRDPEAVATLKALGAVQAIDDPGAARLSYERALALAPEDGDILLSLAYLDLDRGDYDGANKRFNEVLVVAAKQKSAELKAFGYFGLGKAAASPQSALSLHERALKTAADAALKSVEATAHVNLGLTRSRMRESEAARRHFDQALALDLASGDDSAIIDDHMLIGDLERTSDRHAEAEAAYRRAVERALAAKQDTLEGGARLRLAASIALQGRMDVAEAEMRRAIAIFEARDLKPAISIAHSMLGFFLFAAGDIVAARGEFERAHEIAWNVRSPVAGGLAALGRAEAERRDGNWQAVCGYLSEALSAFRAANLPDQWRTAADQFTRDCGPLPPQHGN